jgi:hypothetical protein
MMRMQVGWRGVVAALALSMATPAFAQESAEDLFKEGVAAAEAGQADVAYQKLSAAWKLKQTFDTAGNLGVIENALGKHRDAAEHIDFALRNLPASADASARADLSALLAEVKKKIGTLEILGPAGAALELDGSPIGTAPLESERFVGPGRHVVVAKNATGTAQVDVAVAAGERKSVRLEIAPTPPPKKVEEESPGRPLWPAFVGFGLGAAGVGVGIAGFVLMAQAGADAEEQAEAIGAAPNSERCLREGEQPNDACEEAVSTHKDTDTFRAMGIAGMAVGGAALTLAVVYLVLPDDEKDDAAQPKAAVTPWFGPDGGGVSVSARF